MIYLASPYTASSPIVRNYRYHKVADVVLKLIQQGQVVFSPIVYSHQFSQEIGADFEPWQTFDFGMLDNAEELWVLKIDGWEQSLGTQREISYAKSCGTPVKYLDPVTLETES